MHEQTEEPSVADDDDADRLIETLEAALEAERAARVAAENRLERIIEGCVQPVWRNPMVYVGGGHGFEWRFGHSSGFCYKKADALASVREAAGLETNR